MIHCNIYIYIYIYIYIPIKVFKIPKYVKLNLQFLMHCRTSIIIKDSNHILESNMPPFCFILQKL